MPAEKLATLERPAARQAAFDRAHLGDIEGAFGSLSTLDSGPRRSRRHHLVTLLAVIGPGLFVMTAGNDAGGITTYATAGRDYGTTLLWLVVCLAVVLFVNLEMAARLGAVTGAGHTRLIRERFGRLWGAFALGDLLLVNVFTLATEFVGVTLALQYFGVSRYAGVPAAAAVLGLATFCGNYRRFERLLFVLVGVSLVVIPFAILGLLAHHPAATNVAPASGAAATSHSLYPHELIFIVALAGATVAPWQIFLQQSSVVDKRITSRWVNYERLDTLLGVGLIAVAAVLTVIVCAVAFRGVPIHSLFIDPGEVAATLRTHLGAVVGALFAVFLLNGSVLGAAAVSLSSSYALSDWLGTKQSLHRHWNDAPVFYGTYVFVVVMAAVFVLVPDVPIGLVTTAVQALAGTLLPSAAIFLLLLCNDRAVLGPWVNPQWLNVLATAVVAGLLGLSATATLTAFAPHLGYKLSAGVLGALAAAAVVGAVVARRERRVRHRARVLRLVPAGGLPASPAAGPASQGHEHGADFDDETQLPSLKWWWSMPSPDRLPAPSPSRARTVGLVVLRVYLVVAGVGLVIEVVRLATLHH